MTIQGTKHNGLDWRPWSALAAEVDAQRTDTTTVAHDPPTKFATKGDPKPSDLSARIRTILDRHEHLADAAPETTRKAASVARLIESVREPLAGLVAGLRQLEESAAGDDTSARHSALTAQLEQVVQVRRAVDLAGAPLTTFPNRQLDALEHALNEELLGLELASASDVPAGFADEFRTLSAATTRAQSVVAACLETLDEQTVAVDEWDRSARAAVDLAVETVVGASAGDVHVLAEVARSTLESSRPELDAMFARIQTAHGSLSQRIRQARGDLRAAAREFDQLASCRLGEIDNRPEMTPLKHRLATDIVEALQRSTDIEESLDELEMKSLMLTQRHARSEDTIDIGIVDVMRRAVAFGT